MTTVIGFGAFSSSALAANSTCATHQVGLLTLTAGSGQQEMTSALDFKCGGSNNEAYLLRGDLQYQSTTGVWHQAVCQVMIDCRDFTDTFPGGTEHMPTSIFEVDVSENGACSGNTNYHQNWRNHVLVEFQGSSPDISYNGAANHWSC